MPRQFLSSPDLRSPLRLNGSAGTSGQYLRSNGATGVPSWATLPAIPTITTSFVTLDFGNSPTWAKTFDPIIVPGVQLGNNVIMTPWYDSELEFDMFTCAAAVIGANSVAAIVTAYPGPVAGLRQFQFVSF